MNNESFSPLTTFLQRIPAVDGPVGTGGTDREWWVKFRIDTAHPLAWYVVQELGHVLNYLSPDNRLPTIFIPVSPPPYMNGGPDEFLSWVIECRDPEFSPQTCAEWLEGRLPRPVEDEGEWGDGEED